MKASGRSVWRASAALAFVLLATLVALYARTLGYSESDHLEETVLLRHLKQVDAQWELDVLKSGVGMHPHYDHLTTSPAELGRLLEQVEAHTAHWAHDPATPAAPRTAGLREAIRHKADLIERFKSSHSVLHNSLAFLPTAAEELRSSLGRGGAAERRVAAGVNHLLLTSLLYSRSATEVRGTEMRTALQQLDAQRVLLPPDARNRAAIFGAHVDAILRQQTTVDRLLAEIAAVPTATRIDELSDALDAEQHREAVRHRGDRQYLLTFSALLAGLLLYSAIRLMRSHTEIRRVNQALHDANEHLEQRVQERTRELSDANIIVQNSPTILYRLSGEPSFPLIYISHNITKFGHDPARLLASPDWAQVLVAPDDQAKFAAAMARVLEKDAQGASIEYRLCTGDGARRWVENRYVPVRDPKGRLIEVEGIVIDITERKAAEEHITRLARTDTLTGLANRATFTERLHQAFAAASRGANSFAIHYIDLDHFKPVNDTLGHPVGDLLLREVAQRLQACTRETDLVARLGGDEFALLQAEMIDTASAGVLAGKIQRDLAQPYSLDGHEVRVSASIGVCPYVPGVSAGPDTMVVQADLALYRSKEEGRNQYRFHSDDLDREVLDRVTLGEELRRAIDRDELELYYQPQVELASGKVVGMEALVRWNHPQRGLLSAGAFISIAERAGSIVALGRWVLNRACRQMRQWRDQGVEVPVLAINLSLGQLKNGSELICDVSESIALWGLAPSDLEFDVTEATLAQVTWTRNDVLPRLRELGVRIAIDDFGTEYSSFEYLRTYRVNHLKIAQSMLKSAVDDPASAATIRAIIGLAREAQIGIIVEGVETQAQRDFLQSAGAATLAQGYYFSEPVAADDAGEVLRSGTVGPAGVPTAGEIPAQPETAQALP